MRRKGGSEKRSKERDDQKRGTRREGGLEKRSKERKDQRRGAKREGALEERNEEMKTIPNFVILYGRARRPRYIRGLLFFHHSDLKK